jgi:ankyrin repeat protein
MLASKMGFEDIVTYLLSQGANVYLRDRNGDTALTIANENEQVEVALLLRRAGAKSENKVKKRTVSPPPIDDDDDEVDDSTDVEDLISDDTAPDEVDLD